MVPSFMVPSYLVSNVIVLSEESLQGLRMVSVVDWVSLGREPNWLGRLTWSRFSLGLVSTGIVWMSWSFVGLLSN